jgi:uncharacterized oligopeptide transporter (OPT) family protein
MDTREEGSEMENTYTIPIASGCIAGESIMGLILAALMAFGGMK